MDTSLGQFYTNKEIAQLMISLARVKKTADVLEPSFGQGIFLKELLSAGFSNISGIEIDPNNFKMVQKEFGKKASLKNSDFFKPINKKFDLVIGNPPYVKMKNVPQKTKTLIKSDNNLSSFLNNQTDLFYFFILKSINLLNPGGELVFIVPENFIQATFAKDLRDMMRKEGEFFGLIDLFENKVFKNAGPDPIIFGWRKGLKNHSFNAVSFKKKGLSLKVIKKEAELGITSANKTVNSISFKTKNFSDKWYLASAAEERLIKKIDQNSLQIKNVSQTAVGFISAAEKIFQKPDEVMIEPKALKQFVKAKNCKQFALESFTEMIFLNNVNSEKELKEKYPNTYTYLIRFKTDLLKRWGIKNKWWHWPTIRNAEVFKKPGGKIFVPSITRGDFRFALDFTNPIAGGDVLTIVPEKINPYFLTGWLNSDIFANYFKIRGDKTGQRYYFNQKNFAEQPVINPAIFTVGDIKRIEQMVKEKNTKSINQSFSKKIQQL